MSADDVDRYIRQVLDDTPRFRQKRKAHRYQLPREDKLAHTLENRRAAKAAQSQLQLRIVRVADGWKIESRKGKIKRRSPETWKKHDQAQKALDAGYQMSAVAAASEFPRLFTYNPPRGDSPCIMCQLVGITTEASYCVRVATSENDWFYAHICQRNYHYQVEFSRLVQYRADGHYAAIEKELVDYHREYKIANGSARGPKIRKD